MLEDFAGELNPLSDFPSWVTGCHEDGPSATDGLPSAADVPSQSSELAKSAKTGLMQFTKNASLFDQLAVTGQLLGREIKSAGSLLGANSLTATVCSRNLPLETLSP